MLIIPPKAARADNQHKVSTQLPHFNYVHFFFYSSPFLWLPIYFYHLQMLHTTYKIAEARVVECQRMLPRDLK